MEEDIALMKDGEERIEELINQAEMFGMNIDWERLELQPKAICKINYWDTLDRDPDIDMDRE